MAATAEMPYFIKPSVNLDREAKQTAYRAARAAITATIGEEEDELLKMVTINCLLKTHLPYYYWVGFYLVPASDDGRSTERSGVKRLTVGPYQGTLGCLYIDFGRGVCGAVAQSGQTKIVTNTHALAQGREHIACDPNSRSEIVVPVFRKDSSLLGVFDVDSTLEGSFDEVDQRWLEEMLAEVFSSRLPSLA